MWSVCKVCANGTHPTTQNIGIISNTNNLFKLQLNFNLTGRLKTIFQTASMVLGNTQNNACLKTFSDKPEHLSPTLRLKPLQNSFRYSGFNYFDIRQQAAGSTGFRNADQAGNTPIFN